MNRVALVTGAGRGIGRAISIALAEDGCDIIAVDVASPIEGNPQSTAAATELLEVADAVRNLGRECHAHSCDVRDSDGMASIVRESVRALGRIDVVVPQAAVAVHNTIELTSDDEWDMVLGVNLMGVVRTIRPVIPIMRSQGEGRIVAVGSVGSRMGTAGVASYIASKWALVGLIKSAALELGQHNITANIVCPTAVNTPLFRSDEQYRDMIPGLYDQPRSMVEREESVQAMLRANHALPVGWIEPEDVANAVAFLASPRARYVSGEVLDVAAGWNARNSA